ncbi:MAG: hypothetical protein JSV25_07610 [Spirochaetota bacterium]|nr:MAG: hypothetical protein JSV25_07610 [Spirochaetota bacterium]
MDETEILQEELEHYKQEKERVRKILGQVGGKTSKKKDRAINIIFLTLIVFLFSFDFIREIYDFSLFGITSFFSIEIAILLVSIKIIWMIRRQQRVDHFQFWVLNSIEFQINLISKRIRELEDRLGTTTSNYTPS